MSKIPSVNLLLWDNKNKKYVIGSYITASNSIVWDRPIIENHKKLFGPDASSFQIIEPKCTDRFYINNWMIEADEYGNVSLSKKISINDNFIKSEDGIKLIGRLELPQNLLLSSSFDVIQCTNGTSDSLLQRCLISASLEKNGLYYSHLNVTMTLTSVMNTVVEDGVKNVNIYENELLNEPSTYLNQNVYVTIKGNMNI